MPPSPVDPLGTAAPGCVCELNRLAGPLLRAIERFEPLRRRFPDRVLANVEFAVRSLSRAAALPLLERELLGD